MAITIKSFNQFLGDLVRKIKADTPVNDINDGSVNMTLLEAIAANDFENSTAVLNVLELLNIDAVRNTDLDATAANFGLSRIEAVKASGLVNISDSTITKRSTALFSVKPAPIAGSTTLFVNNAADWTATGSLFIGRNTDNFEGPIAYTGIVDNGTFFTITLATALQNDHLISEEVVDAQGSTDRVVPVGTRVKIPANNLSPEIGYTLLREAVLPAGEDTITGISVIAEVAGSFGNAGINTLTSFDTIPFAGAEVTNSSAFTSGRDIETDAILRDRVKSFSDSLAKGTKEAILTAIDGLSDADENKQVTSAIITEPTSIGDPSITYIDDGSGFEPSFTGQSVDSLLKEATGNEEFLQLANFPLPRPQVVNTAESPFELTDGMMLKVLVDGVEESVTFTESDFTSISSATLSEIVIAINDKADTFKCRLTESSTRLLISANSFSTETIQISSDATATDVNTILKFPVNEFSYITLYQDNTRLREIEKAASIVSTEFTTWNITSSGNLILSIDGTPSQDQTFNTSDFGGAPFATLDVDDYVTAFNNKFAGLTATATTTGKMILSSNREGSASSIEVLGGTWSSKIFSGVDTASTGQDSDFSLNRQTGNLRILTDIDSGDSITAGSEDVKGSITSIAASSGTFTLSTDSSSRPAEVIIVADATKVVPRSISLPVASTLTVTDEGSNVMRIMADTALSFREIQPLDYVYIANRGDIDGTGAGSWLDIKSCGLYRVTVKGGHVTDGADTYLEVNNDDIVAGGAYTVADADDIQAFYSDKYPQLWRASEIGDPPISGTPALADIQDVVDSINYSIRNVVASVYRTNFVKLTSSTEEDGSIAIPVSIGNATLLFTETSVQQEGNSSHIANKRPSKDIITTFNRTAPTNTDVWLDRHTYTDKKGSLTSNAVPGATAPYGETLVDTVENMGTLSDYNSIVNILGNNKGQYRAIQEIADANTVNTREDKPTTVLDHVIADEYQITKALEVSSEDDIVTIVDNDAVANTVSTNFSRRGRVNSGSQSGSFLPINGQFSADDDENETGIDFGTLNVWGKTATQTNTEFADYAVWFKARNWYATGGVGAGASMILRSNQYGPIGEKTRFKLEYPTAPSIAASDIFHTNTAESTTVTHVFGSDAPRITAIGAGDVVAVSEPVADTFRYDFPGTVDFSSTVIGDVVTFGSDSGFTAANSGTFRVNAVNDTLKTIDVYNPSGVVTIAGVAERALYTFPAPAAITSGQYFIAYSANDANGYYFWYRKDAVGVDPAPGGGLTGVVIDILSIDTANDVATKSSAEIVSVNGTNDFQQVVVALPAITIENVSTGISTDAANVDVGTLTISTPVQGVDSTDEIVAAATDINIYPILNTNVTEIVDKINESDVMTAVVVDSGTITLSTFDEATVIAYSYVAHDSYVTFHDSESWIDTFANTNPNFQLKQDLLLPGVEPTIYKMDLVENEDATTGELFKLVPITLTNLKHQLSHKALSQLEIISDVEYSSNFRRVQLKSEKLGSQGAIEIVGGKANAAELSILGDSQVSTLSGEEYLEVRVPAFPDTLSIGHHIELSNTNGVRRYNRLTSGSTMDVVKITDTVYEYRYNGKTTNFTNATTFTITDNSAGHGRPAGTVWRWTISTAGTETLLDVNAGDMVSVFGATLAGWAAGNKAGTAGDNEIAGLPIVEVGAAYFDVVNPDGVAMGATIVDISGGEDVLITPTPIIEWNLQHTAASTKYKIESLGYNDMFRLKAVSGDLPNFTDMGVAVDDLLLLSGETFESFNNGEFRVRAVENDSIIYKNTDAADELHTIVKFNATDTAVTWTASSTTVSGAAGAFANVSVGDWVKKADDDDTYYVEVTNTASTSITLGAAYEGTTSVSIGIAFDQTNDVGAGVILADADDIRVFEGDAVRVADSILVSTIVNASWFSTGNQGTHSITQIGTNGTDYRPFLRVSNTSGVADADIPMNITNTEFAIIESSDSKFTSIKQVAHVAIDDFNNERRKVYLTPGNRSYKWNQSNGSSIESLGKIGFDNNIVTGVDGYLYYTGLLRTVQRTIDGFEPDKVTYPGQKGVGSLIETLPPLIRRVSITVDVTTKDGINLSEITDEIKSSIVDVISNLGVSEDVILSDIIVRIMSIDGVAAVTFVEPEPTNERISISSNEKAFIETKDISIA